MKFFLPSAAIVLALALCAQSVPTQQNGQGAKVANHKTEQDRRLWSNGDNDEDDECHHGDYHRGDDYYGDSHCQPRHPPGPPTTCVFKSTAIDVSCASPLVGAISNLPNLVAEHIGLVNLVLTSSLRDQCLYPINFLAVIDSISASVTFNLHADVVAAVNLCEANSGTPTCTYLTGGDAICPMA